MKKIKSYFLFSAPQQKGIFSLLLCIAVVQLGWFFYTTASSPKAVKNLEEVRWLRLESQIDSIKAYKLAKEYVIRPFNPNFISDYKGYQLGMSVAEIDRLQAFRKENKYVNSAREFQRVTLISDSLLAVMAPYFKFPDWVKNKAMAQSASFSKTNTTSFSKKEPLVVKDINLATQEDLMKINGIGEGISKRILQFKERLGGFVSMAQMNDVWGLSAEVIEQLQTRFKVGALPPLKKIDINNASVKDLAQFPYFSYQLAREIVIYRSMHGVIKNATDLTKIKGMSIENATIIALYLDF